MAKQYTLSFAAAQEHTPEHPERTAKRSFNWDIVFQVWPNRAAMARSIRMQERNADVGQAGKVWRACVPLTAVEGY